MISYIKGGIESILPNYVVIDIGGIGYHVNISVYTFEKIKNLSTVKLYTYLYIKENIYALYGFYDDDDRNFFLSLLSIKGIGPNTAMNLLSSLRPEELYQAIVSNNLNAIKSVKGLGIKAAERIIFELKGKLQNIKISNNNTDLTSKKDEAILALTTLGMNKTIAENKVAKIMSNNSIISLEEIIKNALKLNYFE